MTAAPRVLANVTSMQPARRPEPVVEAITATVASAASSSAPAAITARRPARVQRSGSDRRLFWSIMTIVGPV